MNIHRKAFLKAICTILVYISFVAVTNGQYSLTKHGILVTIENRKIEMDAVPSGFFRLSVLNPEGKHEISSVFIENNNDAQVNFQVVTKAPVYGIKTSFGEFLINTNLRTWSIADSTGKLLISNGSIYVSDTAQIVSFSESKVNALTYGSGNYTTKSLLKKASVALQGNGTVDLPYFWNNAGYCALGLTADDNKPAAWNNSGNNFSWKFTGKSADLYIWPASTLYDATHGLAKLTGNPKLPPRWAFGYLQSQWGWADRNYIEDVLFKFRSHKLPVDAFIYDFEWYTVTPDYFVKENGKAGFTDFSFNPKLFPEPARQIADYKSKGVKFIGIRKPRLGDSLNLILARKNGWLKKSIYSNRDIDFSNESLRNWYAGHNKPLLDAGVDAWWNDEGENYYSCYYWWNKTQFDLRASARPNDRHFSINRSFSLGNQRLGYCTWNGDVNATWEALLQTPADLLNWSLSDMVYGSCDIGGFHGTPSKELLVRWFQAGVFFPIMRAHSDIGVTPHFPWLWENDGEAAIRKALNLRYQLLPYIYSLGHEAYRSGRPIMRPLVMEFPNDTTVSNLTDEWLVGKGLLAAPVLNEGGKRDVYLPEGLWYDFETGRSIKGPVKFSVTKNLDETPVYVSAGTILPLGPVIQHTEEEDTVSTLEIRIYPGRDGKFVVAEDDGISYNYMKGNVRLTTFSWSDATKTLSWKVEGKYTDKKVYKNIRVICGNQNKTASLHKKGNVILSN